MLMIQFTNNIWHSTHQSTGVSSKSTTFLFIPTIMEELALLTLSGRYSIDFLGLPTVMRLRKGPGAAGPLFFGPKIRPTMLKYPKSSPPPPPSPLSLKLPLVNSKNRSKFSVNQQVVQDLRGRIQRLPNFQRHVITVRRQLMGVVTTPEHKRYVKAPHNHKHYCS